MSGIRSQSAPRCGLVCCSCRAPFELGSEEVAFYARSGYGQPTRCQVCRERRRFARELPRAIGIIVTVAVDRRFGFVRHQDIGDVYINATELPATVIGGERVSFVARPARRGGAIHAVDLHVLD